MDSFIKLSSLFYPNSNQGKVLKFLLTWLFGKKLLLNPKIGWEGWELFHFKGEGFHSLFQLGGEFP